jgi:hypothetical protein
MPEKKPNQFCPDHLSFYIILSNGAQNAEKFLLSAPILRRVSEPNSSEFGSVSRTSAGESQFTSTNPEDAGWD